MSDTITPASLRAHAAHFAGRWHLVSEALIDEAARLEAESARDEEAERYAKVYRRAQRREYPTLAKWGSLDADTQENYIRPMRAVLGRLAADGRLLPEGGTVLTAEQVAEARELLDAVDLDAEEFHLLRAAFTPPAEPVPDSEPEDPCGGTGTVECWNPGRLCTEKVCELCGPCRTCDPNAPILFANSGPDGTPENPWPTWQDAPEGAVYRGTHRDGSPTESRWMNRGGECWVVDGLAATHPESYRLVNSFAPFVRVDGDKA
ncbi:hypothetical protein [Prescottella equi]|uniref:hypothetical protein n=1 Tax=Rhodococcus hoagii TaxID=43767 RepID=UPI000B1CFE6A|nr:hypothetical protein [Prescottella equi]